MSDNSPYVHLTSEQCQSERQHLKRRGINRLIIAAVVGLCTTGIFFLVESYEVKLISLVTFALAVLWGLFSGWDNIDYEELDSPRYFEALNLAETSNEAAALLKAWTDQSTLLSFGDLNELKRVASAEEELAGRHEVQLWRERQEQV